MKVGTKSLLFGVHHIIWHPMTVLLAWNQLYGLPNYKELICIFIHDWGYFGCADMDGVDGSKHSEFAATIARKLLGDEYGDLCLYHSRQYSKAHGVHPSRLCYADKLSIVYEPRWFYLWRAKLTGELHLYRDLSDEQGEFPKARGDKEWFDWLRTHMSNVGRCAETVDICDERTLVHH